MSNDNGEKVPPWVTAAEENQLPVSVKGGTPIEQSKPPITPAQQSFKTDVEVYREIHGKLRPGSLAGEKIPTLYPVGVEEARIETIKKLHEEGKKLKE